MVTKYTREVLAELISNSFSFAEVKRKAGVTSGSGGTVTHLKRQALKFGIDFSHFPKNGINGRNVSSLRRNWQDVLVYNSEQKVVAACLLRRCLIESGRVHKCEGTNCVLAGVWLGKPLRLQIHHINGNRYDNRMENLLFLCPNCHSQTENYSYTKVQKAYRLPMVTLKELLKTSTVEAIAKLCCVSEDVVGNWAMGYGFNRVKSNKAQVLQHCECGKEKHKESIRCRACAGKLRGIANRKVTRPSKEVLTNLVWELPTTEVANRFGVSDVTVAKWCKSYGINKPPRGFWMTARCAAGKPTNT